MFRLSLGTLAVAVLLAGVVECSGAEKAAAEKLWVYIGTYTGGSQSKGIYLFELDTASGKLTPKGLAAETANPSFLAIHPSRKFLYSVGEISDFAGKKAGAVSAFAIDPKTGKLTLLNQQPSGGAGPCHLVVDKLGKTVLVANYGGGSVASLPIQDDGRLKEAASTIQHKGSSVNKQRQEAPHAHSINLDPANRFAFAADLGLDKVMVYRFDPASSTLIENNPPAGLVKPGAGPRHFAFHPSGKYAYVINELDSTVTAFAFDPSRGSLTEIQTITTLPADYKGVNYPAEVQVHPSGKFLYGSNRRQESIVVYAIDEATGKLTHVQHQSEKIKEPRNFGIDPSGQFMIAGSQNADLLVVFRIDPKTGALTPTGQTVEIPRPVCVKFMPAGG